MKDDSVAARADALFSEHIDGMRRRTDRLMAWLMGAQWLFAVLIAVVYSPYAWEGTTRSTNVHVLAAVFLGGAISSLPIALAIYRPGATLTRHVVAVAQMLWSGLLIHLTGGRIETHFHVFGSLAFLAFYRDVWVLAPATVVVAADHVLRQFLWPESVYGVSNPEWWRFLEHAGWVVFEDVFLVIACLRGVEELRRIATQRAELEAASALERTKSEQLDEALQAAIAARDAADQASRVKSQFLANMSHELRTPINGVIGMAELASRTELSAQQRKHVETIRKSGEALLGVINDILDFSKVEAGKLEVREEVFDPASTVRSVADLVTAQVQAKGIELVTDVGASVPKAVHTDPARLQQILVNIVGNAVKFTERGEVAIRVRAEPRGEGEMLLRFDVTDTGIGIAPDVLGQLFRPFSQVDGSDRRKYGGTGLGLAIAKQIVELLGGEIEVESTPGVGSRFAFTLPCQVGAAPTPIPPRPDLRVLIVDDNATNREVLKEHLSWASVDEASDAAGALELARQAVASGRPYSLVVSDVEMPKMDGLAFVGALRALPSYGLTPVVMLSSSSEPRVAARAKELHVHACLPKPIDRRALLERVLEAVGGRRRSTGGARPASKARVPLTGRRLLLAEDNEVNREVAVQMLAVLGFEIDVVTDGQQAVEAAAARDYDAILMDCQMPRLSGYEATTAIRKREGLSGHVPVIAVTASALQGDRERALAAGMDDHLAKPLSIDGLGEALARWLPAGSVAPMPAAEKSRAPAPIAPGTLLDPKTPRSPKVVELAIGQIDEARAALREALAAGDRKRVGGVAHKLKGTCLVIGAQSLADACRSIEGSGGRLEDDIGTIESRGIAVQAALREELRAVPTGGGAK